MSKQLLDNLNEIKNQKDTYLLPENIKKDVTVLGITGTMETGIDTSDATATVNDIISPKTAYKNGSKITGNIIPTYSTEQADVPDIITDYFINDTDYELLDYNITSKLAAIKIDNNVRLYNVKNNILSKNNYITSFALDTNFRKLWICDNNYNEYVVCTFFGNSSINNYGITFRCINKTTGEVTKTVTKQFENVYNRASFSNVCTSAFSRKYNIVCGAFLASNPGAGFTYGVTSLFYAYDYKTNTITRIGDSQSLLYNHGGNTSDPIGNLYVWCTSNGLYYNMIATGRNGSSCSQVVKILPSSISILSTVQSSSEYNIANDDGLLFSRTSDPSGISTPFDVPLQYRNSIIKNYLLKYDTLNNDITIYSKQKDEYKIVYTLNNTLPTEYFNDLFCMFKYNNSYYLLNTNIETTNELLILDRLGVKFYNTSDADTTTDDIVEGKVVYGSAGRIIGTMPNNGELNYTSSNTEQTIPAGYTSGGTIAAYPVTEDEYNTCLELTNQIIGNGGN